MSDKQELAIRCPVCNEPHLFIEGDITLTEQMRFVCHSPKCRGKNRYINSDFLKKIVDNYHKIAL